jgi:hypothetical protein
VHEKLADKASQIETLSKSALYLLAAPSMPIREEAIERVEAGERLSLAEVKAPSSWPRPRRMRGDRRSSFTWKLENHFGLRRAALSLCAPC